MRKCAAFRYFPYNPLRFPFVSEVLDNPFFYNRIENGIKENAYS